MTKLNSTAAISAIAIVLASASPLLAQPREILIIRHAEKPESSTAPNLTSKGYARAAALVQFFSSSFDTPDFLFATQVSKNSNRPVETITPLASALHMSLNSKTADADFAVLAQDILANPQYTGRMIIICWHHGTIPDLAKAFGAADVPKSWPDAVFDRVWRLQFGDSGTTLTILQQHLLFGDSSE